MCLHADYYSVRVCVIFCKVGERFFTIPSFDTIVVVRRFTPQQVQRLKQYVYKSEGAHASLLDPYLQVSVPPWSLLGCVM